MGSTNFTPNYELSQFIGTDKPAWLQDYNGDMLKIDTGIAGAKTAADNAQSAADGAQGDATAALSGVADINTELGTVENTLSTATGNINTINSLIGNGTPTTTDQTIIGAINELHADQGNLDNLDTVVKTSLVGAINEVNGKVQLKTLKVTADGVKTLQQLFVDAISAIDNYISSLSDNTWYNILNINVQGVGTMFANKYGVKASSLASVGGVDVSTVITHNTGIDVFSASLRSTSGSCAAGKLELPSGTFTSYSTDVPASGNGIWIEIMIVK